MYTHFNVLCTMCNTTYVVAANPADVQAWQQGTLIQVALYYLSAAERELLISGICATCYTKLFGEEE